MAKLNGKEIILAALKGDKGDPGKDLDYKKTYKSIAEMNSDFNNPNIKEEDYVLLSLNNVLTIYQKGPSSFIEIGRLTGPKGEPGEKGKDGVVVTSDGNYGFNIEDGNLVLYTEGTNTPTYQVNDKGEMTITIE